MFKRTIAILGVLILGLFSLWGCGGDKYDKIDIDGKQDTSYAVTSNGGSAVRYGNYVYFINGTRGYEDTDATANVFGEVVKGAVYRAEVIGDKLDGDIPTFKMGRDGETYLPLKSHKGKDNKRNDIDVVDVERIAPKTVGTSGFGGGGLFIYGDCLYYASPNNQRNKTGDVQYNKTDFFRMTLDGKSTKKIYTTKEDSSTSPYMFYSKGDSVYLVVLDGTDLKSMKIAKKNGKVSDEMLIAEDVTAAVMPAKPVYYDGINEDTIYDFVYFKRSATGDDVTQSGEVLEFVRPDGTDRTIFEATSAASYTLETVRDGYLFYRKSVNDTVRLVATNLHSALALNDEAYAAKYDGDDSAANVELVGADFFPNSSLDGLTVYPYVPGYEFGKVNTTNAINVLYVADSGATLALTTPGNHTQELVTGGSSITIDTVVGNDVFFTDGGSLKRVNVGPGSDFASITVADNVTVGTYGADCVGEFVMFFGQVEADATGYAFMYEVEGLAGHDEPKFVGELSEEEKLSETESISITEQPEKKEYKVGEKLDLTGLKVEATAYADNEGDRPDPYEVEITDDMVSGFDSSVAGSVTVTVTYDKKTADFTVTVVEEEGKGSSCATVAPVSPWFFIGGGGMLVLAAAALFAGKRYGLSRR